jgi:hypothetical protein
MTPRTLQILNGALAVGFKMYQPLVLAHAIAEFVSDPGRVERFAKKWELEVFK